MVIRATFPLKLATQQCCTTSCTILLRYCNTSNKIVQLVAQRCCVASCRANAAGITTTRAANFLFAESRKSFYVRQQNRATKIRVVIRATFTLQRATQQFCATSCTIFFIVFPYPNDWGGTMAFHAVILL